MTTKTRIMDAAERLFAEKGFDAASLRAITAAAGVNLAAVNYHFRSKDALIEAVFARKLEPLSRKRLELLGRYESEGGGRPVPVEKILRALLEPLIHLSREPSSGWDKFRMLVGRMYTAPKAQRIFVRELEESMRRFGAAMQRACPQLSFEDLCWRVYFIIGAMAHALASGTILEIISQGKCSARQLEAGIERLITFAAAGLQAPPAGKGAGAGGRRGRQRCVTD